MKKRVKRLLTDKAFFEQWLGSSDNTTDRALRREKSIKGHDRRKHGK